MTNKTVLITGAAKRLGADIARDLHHRGMDIVIHYNRSSAQARSLVDELNERRPGSAGLVQADLNDATAAVDIVDAALDINGRLDALINNASSFYPTPVADASPEQWDDLFNTNLKAPFFLAQRAYGALKESRGCIVNIADIHGERPLRGYAIYSTAKAGLIMLTRVLAREFGPAVRVNAISPGAIIWPEDMHDEIKGKILSRTVLKRCGNPRDIASAVNFLINDAGYITGQVLTIDGGRTLYS